ncbi:DUF1707 domain-containing protein [Amycolatopsis sp.]|uniref:DUF1707 SHOCT-like domain-containing protein n=1 Tax=Amycolatopsis sp. TaxID=37632 RepID=UPI002E09BFCB|nr:DUF1707 domain-containing protein [Amycolatopsis sp.]
MTSTASNVTSPPVAVRCSDAERERTSAAVQAAIGEGRLSIDEVEQRLTEIYAARYRHELDAITSDLPPADQASSWGTVFTLARRQLIDDASALLSRGADLSHRRKLALILIAVTVVLLVATTLMLVAQGIVADGPEIHEFGRG